MAEISTPQIDVALLPINGDRPEAASPET